MSEVPLQSEEAFDLARDNARMRTLMQTAECAKDALIRQTVPNPNRGVW
jgi:hypothetical protein